MYQSEDQKLFARQLRSSQTEAEHKLWSAIRKRQLAGFRFRRQFAIGPYVSDFECFEAKLIVELDGGQHNSPDGREHDSQRTAYMEEHGYAVLRFWNSDVTDDLDAVLEKIAIVLKDRALGRLHPSPPPAGEGELR
ncbi:MAG: endonuclease domain-containing protein [Planctomycetota bacterium]